MHNRLINSLELSGRVPTLETAHHQTSSELSHFENQVCLFGPERYEAKYDYPLVVWLHSSNSDEHELESVMPVLSLQNYVACAPRGTIACDPAGKRFRWGQSEAAIAIAEEVLFDAIQCASSHFSIDHKRIFLAGFGSGATTAWRVALRYPSRFAGIISVCGDFPSTQRPLNNLVAARELPMLWMFGAESESCGITQVCEALPVLHAARLTVDIRQYPCGDELLTNMLSDMNSWIMERVTNQPATYDETPEAMFSNN
ncbi:MAG: hypothetical protein KDB03_17945 [Planctomycetales bacterium]|nr:hypothetical protein [Planctomycetales bacterium]